jgi:histidyl-tRNA synthetase
MVNRHKKKYGFVKLPLPIFESLPGYKESIFEPNYSVIQRALKKLEKRGI